MSAIEMANAQIQAAVLPFGAALQSLRVRRDGGWRSVVLSRDNLEAPADGFLGASVGRVANRIAGAHIDIDGVGYQLDANEPPLMLHGGTAGFSEKMWEVRSASPDEVVFNLESPDKEMGFPGNLSVAAVYKLLADGVQVEYTATTDAPTAVNLTNHAYFNLAGDDSGPIDAHLLQIFASAYTPTDAAGVPTGEIRPVAGTPLDFTRPAPIGQRREQAAAAGLTRLPGIDTNFCVDGEGLRPLAKVTGPDGLTLTVSGDAPGVQAYDCYYFCGKVKSPRGVPYGQYAAIALEPQAWPDAPHHPGFPDIILRPGQVYRHTIRWQLA
ncbi:MAG: galactose mutarotase [Propionibacteriaceae bacterium]|jgi:aldose 1-epimerase|nr:galactose mutarotase [Propionibacteriaceae bacterium]